MIDDIPTIIQEGHPPMARRVALIDFDGTLFPFGRKFNHDAQPLPGSVEFMQRLKADGYKIVIFTSRLSESWLYHEGEDLDKHVLYIIDMCNKYNIPFDDITAEKIPAEFYIDDKAIPFGGDWSVAKTWYESRP